MFNKLHFIIRIYLMAGYFYNYLGYIYIDTEINSCTVREKILSKMLLKWKYLTVISLLSIKHGGKGHRFLSAFCPTVSSLGVL